jgi:hypothetical protein
VGALRDEQRGAGVPRIVEAECGIQVGVPDGRLVVAPVERVVLEDGAVAGGEYQVVRAVWPVGKVGGQHLGEERRNRHHARLVRLGGAEHELSTLHVGEGFLDVDATPQQVQVVGMRFLDLVLAHSDLKEGAAGTYKHSFGPRCWPTLDRGQAPGEPLASILWPGNAAPRCQQRPDRAGRPGLAQLARSAGDQPILVCRDSAAASTRLAWHLPSARSPSRSACRSTPMSARRSLPNPSRPGPSGRPRWSASRRRGG